MTLDCGPHCDMDKELEHLLELMSKILVGVHTEFHRQLSSRRAIIINDEIIRINGLGLVRVLIKKAVMVAIQFCPVEKSVFPFRLIILVGIILRIGGLDGFSLFLAYIAE